MDNEKQPLEWEQLFSWFLTINDCNDYGVAWLEPVIGALRFGEVKKFLEAFHYLDLCVQKERLKLGGWIPPPNKNEQPKPKPTKKRKPKNPPTPPAEGAD